MVSGYDRYMQIAKCFRDEDLRADRQPEFTQIDIEMSFVEEEDVWGVVEGMMGQIFNEIKGVELPKFPRLTYNECMERFGSDKPDTRFELEIQDITEVFKNTTFEIFKNIIKGLEDGELDIVIGTHKLLQESVKFKDLGLLVLDEEQRFGVEHKEKLKLLKENRGILWGLLIRDIKN